MKKSDKPKLEAPWWNTNKPISGIDKTEAKFAKSLTGAGAVVKGLGKEPSEDDLAKAEQALTMLSGLAEMVVAEARKSSAKLKKSPADKDLRESLDATVHVLSKPLSDLIDEKRKTLEALAGEDEGDLNNSVLYTAYLSKILPKVKKKPMNFAFGMVSGEADGHRLIFHRSRSSAAMAKKLRKDIGARKLVWGVAQGSGADEGDDLNSKTLAFDLEGKNVPGTAKRARMMFAKLAITTIKRVLIRVDGVQVESDAEGDGDEIEELTDEDAVEEPQDTPALLQEGWEKLKVKVLPLLANARLAHPNPERLQALIDDIQRLESEGKFAEAIAMTRDKGVPVLKALGRAPDKDTMLDKAPAPVAPVTDAPNPLNASLGKVLGRMYPPDDRGWFMGWVTGSSAAPKTPTEFFGGVAVTYKTGETPPNEALRRDWAINLALLQHASADLPADSPAKAALDARAMGYLLKFANIPNTTSKALDWQGNPIDLGEKDGSYHRSGASPLYEKTKALTATSLGVDDSNICLCSDPRIMEEVRRQYSSSGELVEFENFDDIEFSKVITAALAGQPAFVDVTSLMKADGGCLEAAGTLTDAFRKAVWKQVCAKHGLTATNADELPGDLADEIRAEIDREVAFTLNQLQSNMKFGGIARMGEQPVLGVFRFPATGAVDQDSIKLTDEKSMRELQGHSGFTAGPQQLFSHLTAITPDVPTALRELGVVGLPKVVFPKNQKLPKYDDFTNDFMANANVAAFSGLSADPSKPYAAVTSTTIAKMMTGLNEEGVKEKLEAQGLGHLWQLSLNRIEGFMASAVRHQDAMPDYLNDVQLIMEEISTLLSVAKPYDEASFNTAMKSETDMLPAGFEAEGISVEFSLKNSASRCFNAVLTACEDAKEAREGDAGHLAKRGLQVLVQGDSYYEPGTYVLETAKDHTAHGFDTDNIDAEEAFNAQFESLKESGGKLEVYLCEFHHNISYDRTEYKPEDVAGQVRKLIDGEVAANPFTVAIDTTIAKTDDPQIKGFLDAFKDEIKSGAMNVVIYRSAQKFDQMGADTYNGGVMCVIAAEESDDATTGTFKQALDRGGEPALDENIQGLTHLNKHAQEELNAYRGAIMENTAKLSNPNSTSAAKLPDDMLLSDANVGGRPLRFALNTDTSAPFVDLKFPDLTPVPEKPKVESGPEFDAYLTKHENAKGLYQDLFNLFGAMVAEDDNDLAGSHRASFGFQHANVTLIDSVKMRFNPGLEDETRLAQFSEIIVDSGDIMETALNDLKADHGLNQQEAEKAIATGLLRKETVLAHRGLKEALAGDDEAATNAARLAMAEAWSKTAREPMACNPCGGIRELDAITEPFKTEKAAEILAIRSKCDLILSVLRIPPKTNESHLKLARLKLDAGLPGPARVALQQVAEPEAEELEQRDAMLLECDAQDIKWDDEAQALLEQAEAAMADVNPTAVLRALKGIDHALFKQLRKDRIDELTDWAKTQSKQGADKAVDAIKDLPDDTHPQVVLDQIADIKRSLAAIAIVQEDLEGGEAGDREKVLAALDSGEASAHAAASPVVGPEILARIMTPAQAEKLADLETKAKARLEDTAKREKVEMLFRRVGVFLEKKQLPEAEKFLTALDTAVRMVAPERAGEVEALKLELQSLKDEM